MGLLNIIVMIFSNNGKLTIEKEVPEYENDISAKEEVKSKSSWFQI